MLLQIAKRMLTEPDRRLLAKFAVNFGLKGLLAVRRFQKRLRRGEVFPPFWFLSVTNQCNLHCQGCWVSVDAPTARLDAAAMNRVITDARKRGGSFFGLLGGEPLLHPEIFDVLRSHPDCYFQLFTNGTILTDAIAQRMRRVGNVTPLVSIEGKEIVSDERRGGRNVYSRTLAGLEHCRRHRLITGVASSLCKSNIDDLLTERFCDELVSRGVHYLDTGPAFQEYYDDHPTGHLDLLGLHSGTGPPKAPDLPPEVALTMTRADAEITSDLANLVRIYDPDRSLETLRRDARGDSTRRRVR